MLFILNQVYRFLRLLHADTTPLQISGGIAVGMFLGLTPLSTLQGVVAVGCLFLLRVQVVATVASAICFSLIAIIATPLFHSLGVFLLADIPSLQPLYHMLSDMPVVPTTLFYNSVVMGAGVVSLVAVPVTLFVTWMVLKRSWSTWENLLVNSRLWSWWQQTPPYIWYKNYAALSLDELRAQHAEPSPENPDASP